MNEELNPKESINGHSFYPVLGLEEHQFREAAQKLIDIIINYHRSLKNGERPTLPDVAPGYMRMRVEETAPLDGEKWQTVFKDIEKVVFEGGTHWVSPNNLGFFPAGCSYPSSLGDMLISALGQIGFTWFSSPACTELEIVMMDWLAKALDLPECFVNDGKGPGGGVIQGTACEATLMTLLSARTKVIEQEQTRDPTLSIHEIAHRMVAYSSKCSHSSVERASKISMVNMRLLDVDSNASLRGATLRRAIEEDLKNGKIPIYVCATLGTTACCSFDNLDEIGDVCRDFNLWLHVDAAYAGSALLCPEYRCYGKGLEKTTSFVFNPHKWMTIGFDCSALWVRNACDIENSLKMNPVYLQHDEQNRAIDYMHWQIPLSRRFRSIKIWFTMRMVGMEGLRHNIREGVERGMFFEELVRSDERFEVVFPVTLGVICFRLVIPNKPIQELNKLNQDLYGRVLSNRTFLITVSEVNGIRFLRVSTGISFCTCTALTQFWNLLQIKTREILKLQV